MTLLEDGYPVESAQREQPPAPSFGVSDWLRWAWRQLTSMRIALILLFLLAVGSVPGSMLPQTGVDPSGVLQYFKSHPALAPWLNHLGLFNVFAAPWFAAIYLLLFTSLVGCVVPRTFRLAGAARALPPRAPRNLSRLPHSAEYGAELAPGAAADTAGALLARRGFRLRRSADDGDLWISAEKGYLREAGNLLFHLALLGLLVAIALGGLFGYKANRLLVEGDTFADTASALDAFHPGRLVGTGDLPPFTITLDKFDASYITSGDQQGQPSSFTAYVSYTDRPGDPVRHGTIAVNRPLPVDGADVYLIGHGYAPVFKVTDARGHVVYNQATPFVNGDSANLLSEGVVKVSDAQPEQLGFTGVFVPTADPAALAAGTLESVFPAPDNPVVSLIGYAGNLGVDSGAPQSVYELDTSGMTQVAAQPELMQIGQTWTLPGGKGSITFTGYKQYMTLAITHDPGQLPALACGGAALAGLLLSFLVRRRRVFVRVAGSGAGSVVQFGGLARTDASGGFEEEFASLAAEMRRAHAEQVTGENNG